LTVKTAAQETSIEQQIQLVEDLIVARVNAIVIAPGDSQRLVPALKKAADAGIKIINIDNRLDEKAVAQAGLAPVPFISVDNDAGAYTRRASSSPGTSPNPLRQPFWKEFAAPTMPASVPRVRFARIAGEQGHQGRRIRNGQLEN
jgi:ABC-type sugar transport system substrate-binding protein